MATVLGTATILAVALPGAMATDVAAATAAAEPAPVEPAVLRALANQETTDFWVDLAARADLSGAEQIEDWADRGQYVYDRLTATAEASQADLVSDLTSQGVELETFWITNAVLVRGGDEAALAVARDHDSVRGVRATRTHRAPEPEPEPEPVEPAPDRTDAAPADPGVNQISWGVTDIGADRVWSEFGVKGDGIVVGSIGSGVEYVHPALVDQYRGNLGDGSFEHDYSWWNYVPGSWCTERPGPCDSTYGAGGTATIGVVLGDDGSGHQIGVAPQARWIAANCCLGGERQDAALVEAGQFMLAPTDRNGENPRPELRPHIVDNSWSVSGPDLPYADIVDAWTAAGIFGVFANGRGAACNTTAPAPAYEGAWGVGAYGEDHQVYVSSARGPGANGAVKPNLAAPGASIRSSGGRPDVATSYGSFNGTGIAAAHVSGTVALMWSAAPGLVGDVTRTRELLATTAIDTEDTSCGGTAGNNNVYGEGRLDAFAAVAAAVGPAGALVGTVTGPSGGAVAGATVVAATSDGTRSAETLADGTYQLRLPVGGYQVHAEAPGSYAPPVAVRITEDQTVTQDLALELVPELAVEPRVLSSWQRPGETSGHPVTVGNGGTADLTWQVDADGSACGVDGPPPWAVIEPGSGTVAPGAEQTISVTFDSSGLADGERSGDLCLAHNDPTQPPVAVSLSLVVDEILPEEWVQRDRVTPSDRTEDFDGFGWQVDVDGDTAVVLACSAPGFSSAYVYQRTAEGVWREQAKLTPSAPAADCGTALFTLSGSVAIDGDTILLGLPQGPDFTGTVTVFTRSGDQWTEQAQVSGLGYGFEVAIDGDRMFTAAVEVGADGEPLLTYHVFQWVGGDWVRQGEFVMPDDIRRGAGPSPEIDVDGDVAVVNRFAFADAPPGIWRAAVFTRHGDDWLFEAELAPSDGDEAPPDFGSSEVSLDGGTVVVAANDAQRPAAYVFVRDADGWHQQAKLTAFSMQSPSRAVAVDGDRIVVGSEGAGELFLWNRVGDRWRQHATVVPAGGSDADAPPLDCPPNQPCVVTPGRFGRSVALDGDNLVASTYPFGLFGQGNGPAYMFDPGEPAPTVDLAPRAASFGEVPAGSVSDSTTVTIMNDGSADLQLGELSLAGADAGEFALTDDSCSGRLLRPARGCTYEIRFTPDRSSLGQRSAQVTVSSNAATAPDAVTVAGEAVPAPPAIDVLPDRLVASAPEGTRRTGSLLIANQGTADLEWSTFPDPGGAQSLTLRPVRKPEPVPTVPIDLDRVDRARLGTRASPGIGFGTTADSGAIPAASPGTVTFSHSRAMDVTPSTTPRCGYPDGTTTENRYLRTFTPADFGVTASVRLTEVAFGVEAVTVPHTVSVNVYRLVGELSYANLRRLATTTVDLQPQSRSVVAAPVDVTVPAGATLVVEVVTPDLEGTGSFIAGSNRSGETAPSYVAAPECGITEPTSLSTLGFDDAHLVLAVTGRVDCGPPWLGLDPDRGAVGGDDSQLAEVTFDAAGLAPGTHTGNLCLSSNDPRRPLTVVPVTLEVTEAEPVTLDELRRLVHEYRADGEVTGPGAKRLLRAVDDAERYHDRGQDARAIRALERFQEIARNDRYVPGGDAREVLVAAAEELIVQLRDGPATGSGSEPFRSPLLQEVL